MQGHVSNIPALADNEDFKRPRDLTASEDGQIHQLFVFGDGNDSLHFILFDRHFCTQSIAVPLQPLLLPTMLVMLQCNECSLVKSQHNQKTTYKSRQMQKINRYNDAVKMGKIFHKNGKFEKCIHQLFLDNTQYYLQLKKEREHHLFKRIA